MAEQYQEQEQEQKVVVDYVEHVNSNTEYGVVLSGMLVIDPASREKIIVKAAGMTRNEAARMLREAGDALIAEFPHLMWVWDYAAQNTSAPAPSTQSAPQPAQNSSSTSSFEVQNVRYVRTAKGESVVINGPNKEAVWIGADYAKNNFAQYFPQYAPDGRNIDTFTNDKFHLDNGGTHTVYDGAKDGFVMYCHYERNGRHFNLAKVGDRPALEIVS